MSEYHGNIFLGFGACMSKGLIPDEVYFTYLCPPVESNEDGSAKYAQLGTRKIEAALYDYGFKPEEVIVAHPDHLEKAIGPETRVVGLTEHDPLGYGPPTSTFTQILGGEAYNVHKFKEIVNHPLIQQHRPKIILGGGGAWQLLDEKLRKAYGIDCVVVGEGEKVAGPLFEMAVKGEALPPVVRGDVASVEEIPLISGPTICGVVEVARGCGRGCDFCVPDMLRYRIFPLEYILKEVEVNVKAGRKPILHAEDVLRYGAKHLEVNEEAVIQLFSRVRQHPGVGGVGISHFCLSSAASAPGVIEKVAEILRLGEADGQLWLSGQTGIETGSPELAKKHMRGKAKPFKAEEWPEVVVKAFEVLSDNNWVPCATLLIGLPGSTEKDSELTLKLVERLRDYKSIIVPMFTVYNDTTRGYFTYDQMTRVDGELFLACWEHDARWANMLTEEYLRTIDPDLAGGVKSVVSYTVSAINNLIRRCRDEYDCNIVKMVQDLKPKGGEEPPLPQIDLWI